MNILVLGPSNMVHMRRLVAGLADRGHAVHVVSMKPDPIPGATFERFKVPPWSVRYPYRWRGRWSALVREWFQRFDVVSVQFLTDWGIAQAASRTGALVVKAYGSDVDPPPDAPPVDAQLVEARKQLVRCADMVVTSGQWFRQRVADFADVDIANVEALPDGVDLELFRPQPTPPRQTPVVGFFKGFDPVYGPMTMVEAAAHVLRFRPEVRFEFVGAGSLRDACHQRADTLGIAHAIRWIGHQPHEALPRIMSGWDVVAISSRKESFGVAALEASAMELPVVASAVGGLRETVEHERTGILVEPDDPQALGDALSALLQDPERRRAMGLRGRKRVAEKYEWTQCLDRQIRLFETVRQSAIPRSTRALVRS